mmetsp:Transcript_25069/g.65373  ORF Transcript_25069/g.65373 Transcript_25069/m.65373 type:complete len:346 (-) Transcript_25069:58-1095(-)|eukprot:CAMPEP_0182921390 /NCGR_PEP_ID=MMETSP0105_2-20130417/4117_1 /TAXON_ID=81532 ORGANISM="Acanthoeca-like sp., Strain 10tr" /NCGR_SAMPLE_ID=MMETSP0105_2 /ASSEMBLY_ACC=CAM_ASM_000205 /LENGTH=345 /DNA_ID=CAMNT_0025058905 /DNA_START=38 /DNA_END=1078 /DNA_ORIENTATION=+
MRGDARIITAAVALVGLVAYFWNAQNLEGGALPTASGATSSNFQPRVEGALRKIEQLSAEVEALKSQLASRGGRQAAVPSATASGTAGRKIGGTWQRGQLAQRPDEKLECEEWLAGKRDTYMHDSTAKRHVNKGGYTSQYKQDKVILSKFFKNKKGGTYLDIAANHYKSISNTYFMDRCLGWDGMCVEPNPAYHPELIENRSCAVVPKCISDKVETVKFTFPNSFWEAPLGGVDGGQFKERRPDDKAFTDVTIECSTVASILRTSGVTHIDFFSLDVEGHEKKLLSGVDFSKITFDVILCESKCGEILKANGYAKIAMPEMSGSDKVFLRKDGPFGHMLPEVPIP